MKVYKIIIIVLLGSLVFFLTSCKKKAVIVTQDIKIDNIESIDFRAYGDVNVEYGKESKLIYKGDKEYLENLDIKVVNGALIISEKKELTKRVEKIEFFVTMPKIKSMTVTKTSNFVLNDFVGQTDDLNINILGHCNVKINDFEKVQNLNINIKGAGIIDALSNFENLKNLNINISGSGEYNGYLLETENCNVIFTGDGNCKVYVTNVLNVNIEGNGEVYYKGNPQIISSIEGTGFILDQN